MLEGDSADTCTGKFPLMLMGGQAEGLMCADPGASTPIGVNGNIYLLSLGPPYSQPQVTEGKCGPRNNTGKIY